MSELKYETTVSRDEDSPMVRLLHDLVMYGYQVGASDIHVEPLETHFMIRVRVDGILRPYQQLEKQLYLPLMTCAKIRSGMDIAEKRLPQDGHCRVLVQGKELNLRTSTMPTIYGEKMVLRYMNMAVSVDHADTFGMDEVHYRKLMGMLKRSGGIIYFTGPTGSGKSTTLYMILEKMAGESWNIMTIEDPVEKTVAGINQSQVNRQAGLSFETGLRAILRQDPDVIMVGETRDSQTAKLSVRAAISGNLVLSTLHTREAAGAVSRMIDLGVEPFMASESLNGIVSQRLVRKICPCCGETVPAGEDVKAQGVRVKTVRRGRGCQSCGGTGYQGRIAVHEILVADREIRRMIVEQKSSDEIFAYAKEKQNMTTLREGVVDLVERGITTVEELMRVVDPE